ncbi:MAG: hypothetical protein ACLTTH_06795 [Holdemanella porci]
MTGIGYMLPLIIGASLVVAIPKIIALCVWVSQAWIHMLKQKDLLTYYI